MPKWLTMQNARSAILFYTLICALFSCHNAAAAAPEEVLQAAKSQKLYLTKEWLRLGHYEESWRGFKSDADGQAFFVSGDGATNPEGELVATLNGFFSGVKRDFGGSFPSQTVRCQFPARFEWLNRKLDLETHKPDQTPCPEFEEFRTRMAAESVTLVFSSFHVENPSTVFGHTLLRFNKSRKGKERFGKSVELLDYGVNFAANQTTDNPIAYSFLGLVGGFPGTFASMPYYYKVREYADFESRDLWEYTLNLSPEEVNRVVMHLWELGHTHFDYYYLSKNCSFQLLALLDAAAPRLNLSERVPWWVIPTDTVKAVTAEDNLLSNIHFRPSIHTQFNHRASRLSQDELKKMWTFLEKRSTDLSEIADAQSAARIGDAYLDFIDFKYARELNSKEQSIQAWKQALLVSRSKLPVDDTPGPELQLTQSPHLSHGSGRLLLYGATNTFAYSGQKKTTENAMGLTVRMALHDALDPSQGLPDTAEIDFFRFSLRYWSGQNQRLNFEDYAFLGVSRLLPYDELNQKLSWRFAITSRRMADQRCKSCLPLGLMTAGGLTWAPLSSNRILAYAMIEGRSEYSSDFRDDKVSLLAGPLIGAKIRFPNEWGVGIEAKTLRHLNAPSFVQAEAELILRKTWRNTFAVDARLKKSELEEDLQMGLGWYF